MKLSHVTMHFFPIHGGQETYIDSMNGFLVQAGVVPSVTQPSRSITTGKPGYVHFLPRLRYFHRLGVGADWFWFNAMLSLEKKSLASQDVLVSHYPFHYPAISWHDNVIVVSHGVDWPDAPTTLFDRYKSYAAKNAIARRAKIVVNDTNFLRVLGIRIGPGEHLFEQVADNIWVIPNCVDPARFYPTDEERESVILVPRNIRKSRGIHLAIEAFRLFLNRYPEYVMKIAGGPLSGPYYESCLKLANSYSLDQKIQFLGNIPNADLMSLYNKSKLTLIPTLAFEGTSLSALESMACRTPVVSTRVGGLADLPTWQVGATPQDLCDGLTYVLGAWNEESIRQYTSTLSLFTISNWRKHWLQVIGASN